MALILTVGLSTPSRDNLTLLVKRLGHNIAHADCTKNGAMAIEKQECDLAIYVLNSTEKEKWDDLQQLSYINGFPDVLAVVEAGDTEAAEYAVQSGTWDVLYTPCSAKTLEISISRCLKHRAARYAHENIDALKRTGIIGNSPLLERCLRQLGTVAKSDSSVLILGETGTGKELFARAVHENSHRAAHPLIVVDCTNLPASLAESILFGHSKGSFTGAIESVDGLFKQADKGTIFLDEIGELDLNIQKSLLRVIQERRFRPLSAKNEIECDFRIIAATNRDLEAMVQDGQFRQDLYHRINTRTIVLPSLRDRKEDIPLLAAHYTELFCNNLGCEIKEFTEETLEALKLYNWEGNIRELANVVHTTVLNGISEHKLHPQHLPEEIRLFLIRAQISMQDLLSNTPGQHGNFSPHSWPQDNGTAALHSVEESFYLNSQNAGSPKTAHKNKDLGPAKINQSKQERIFSFSDYISLPTLKQIREEVVSKMEYGYLSELINRCDGNFNTAQKMSGLSRARLYELLQKHSLSI